MTKEILRRLIEPALSHPRMLTIAEEQAGSMKVFRLSAHGADYGRICGKRGANLQAINAILEPVAENVRVVLEPPLTSDRVENAESDPEWDPSPVLEMLRSWANAAEAPGTIEISPAPRGPGIYDIFFSVKPPPEILNPLAKWAAVAARGFGGKVCLEGAHYSEI